MEKFGLMDIINKFNETASGKSNFNEAPSETVKPKGNGGNILKDPDCLEPAQYKMNARLQAFIARHDEISKRIDSAKNNPVKK